MTKIQDLRQLAQTIKTEREVGGNTAERVGSAFEGVADALEGTEQIAEMDKAVHEVQQQVKESKDKIQALVNDLPVVQQTGDSTTSVMSQKAVTEALAEGGDTIKNKYRLEVIMPRLERQKVISTDGSIIASSGSYRESYYVTDFVEVKAGQTFTVENAYTAKGTNILAVYSKVDKSYIEGVETLGKVMTAEYTAKSDVYVRICNNTAGPLGKNCKTYMSFEVTSKKSAIFKTETAGYMGNLGIDTNINVSLSYSIRSQNRTALVNVEGCDFLRITPNGSEGCTFAMLKSYTTPTSSSEFPDYVNKVVFKVNAGETVIFDVSEAKYLMFVEATDVNPNKLPVDVGYIVSDDKMLLTSNTNALMYEPPFQDIKVSVDAYVESERFDIEGADRVKFKLFVSSNKTNASKFLDADGNIIKLWGYVDTAEGWLEGETTVPEKAKYLVYRSKSNALEAYIHVYYKKQMSAQKINEELASIRELTANSGYHYLADAYGVTTSNEDNTDKLQALIDMVNKNGGGIIEIGCGTFTFKNTVILKSNVGITGQGIGNTILKMLDGGTSGYALFKGDYIKNIFIRDIEINSTGTNKTGKHLFMRYIEDSYFTHIKSVDSRPTAIGIDFLNHVTITDNIIINGGRMGDIFGNACIGIGTGYDKWENEDFIISNNICINGGQRGIFVEDQARFGGTKKMTAGYGQVICGNVVRGGYRGITVEAGKRVNVSGNTIYGTKIGMGVKVYADDCLFQGNLLVGNNVGVIVDDLSATFVDNNNIAFIGNTIKGGTTGISVKSDGLVSDLTIKDNVIKGYTNGCMITGGVKTLVLQGNNDFSTTISYHLGGEFSNAIIKDNTFMVSPTKEVATSFSGNTKWVEQMN